MVIKRRYGKRSFGRKRRAVGRYRSSRKSYSRSYGYRRRFGGKRRVVKRKLANDSVVVRASFQADPRVVAMQGGAIDLFSPYICQLQLSDFAATPPIQDMIGQYQRYRIKRVITKFIPNKRAMSAQLLDPATAKPMNPPHVDIYRVPIADKQTFVPRTTLADILEQGGVRKVAADRPFSVSWVPKCEQIRQFAVLGNTYSTIRSPYFPTSTAGQSVNQFGECVYIRYPYDPLIAGGINIEFMRYEVQHVVYVEFKTMV